MEMTWPEAIIKAYDENASGENAIHLNCFKRLLRPRFSKPSWRSMSNMPVDFLLSNPFDICLDKCARLVLYKYYRLFTSNIQKILLYFSRYTVSWLFNTLLKTLDIAGRSETGL